MTIGIVLQMFRLIFEAVEPNGSAAEFESKLNEVLYDQGIGWKMERGQIVYRGDQPFEQTVASARHVLKKHDAGSRP